MNSIGCHIGVSAPTVVNSSAPPTMNTVPMIGKILYRPVRDVIWPEAMRRAIRPTIIGSICRPGRRRRGAADDLQVLRDQRDATEHRGTDDGAGHDDRG